MPYQSDEEQPVTPRTAIRQCPHSPTIFDVPRIPAQYQTPATSMGPTCFAICPSGPLDRLRGQLPSLSELHEVAHYVIYHVLSDVITRPMAVLRGDVSELFDEIIPYPLRRSNGQLTLVPFDSEKTSTLASDVCSILNSEVAGSCLIKVKPDPGAKVYVFGERSRGFSFEAPSELELNCTLFAATWNEQGKLYENLVQERIESIIVPQGELYLYLCDNRDVVLIYDESSKYFFILQESKRLKNGTMRTQPRTPARQRENETSLQLKTFQLSPAKSGMKIEANIGPDGTNLYDRIPNPEPEFWSYQEYREKQMNFEKPKVNRLPVASPHRNSKRTGHGTNCDVQCYCASTADLNTNSIISKRRDFYDRQQKSMPFPNDRRWLRPKGEVIVEMSRFSPVMVPGPEKSDFFRNPIVLQDNKTFQMSNSEKSSSNSLSSSASVANNRRHIPDNARDRFRMQLKNAIIKFIESSVVSRTHPVNDDNQPQRRAFYEGEVRNYVRQLEDLVHNLSEPRRSQLDGQVKNLKSLLSDSIVFDFHNFSLKVEELLYKISDLL